MYKLAKKQSCIDFHVYLVVVNWVCGDNTHLKCFKFMVYTYGKLSKIDYKEKYFANKPRQIQSNQDYSQNWLKIHIDTHLQIRPFFEFLSRIHLHKMISKKTHIAIRCVFIVTFCHYIHTYGDFFLILGKNFHTYPLNPQEHPVNPTKNIKYTNVQR